MYTLVSINSIEGSRPSLIFKIRFYSLNLFTKSVFQQSAVQHPELTVCPPLTASFSFASN